MTQRVVIFVWIILFATFLDGVQADTIWKTAEEMATCRTYKQLSQYLRDHRFDCRSNPPPIHQDLVSLSRVPGAGLDACYVGSSDYVPGLQPGFLCSVAWDRRRYRSIACTRTFPDGATEHSKSTLPDWDERLFARALKLKSCKEHPIDMSFASRSVVPVDLWKWYRHETGVVLNDNDSRLYLGIGKPSRCGKAEVENGKSVGVISFFLGGSESEQPDPLFWETTKGLSPGIAVIMGGMRNFSEIQRLFGESRMGHVEMPPWLSFTTGFVGLRAKAMMHQDNLEALLRFRRMEFSEIFKHVWYDLEEDLDLYYTGEDIGDYVDVEGEMYPGFQELRCQLGGHVDFDGFFDSMIAQAELFLGRGLPGCRRGEVFVVSLPVTHFTSLEAETGFILIGQHCGDISRTQRTILRGLENRISHYVMEELEEIE